VALDQKAWQDGVPIAAYLLGHLYEAGVAGFQPDLAKAWEWYQRGADAGEPHALARFAERTETQALDEPDPQNAAVFLLQAFTDYAAAAERAHDEDWPDDVWKRWRYRRASLARILAKEGRMQQVADAYAGREPPTPTGDKAAGARQTFPSAVRDEADIGSTHLATPARAALRLHRSYRRHRSGFAGTSRFASPRA